MDELLQKLAGRYRGTYFCRTPIASKGDAGFRHLAVEQFPGEVPSVGINTPPAPCLCDLYGWVPLRSVCVS